MLSKKGQSLVEVMVAIGIIAMVFTGTVTLIVQVVNLELSARNRTEAVALGQKYLAENIRNMKEGCTHNIQTGEYDYDVYHIVVSCRAVSTELVELDETAACDSETFVKINVATTWTDKNLPPETFEISEIVRLEQ